VEEDWRLKVELDALVSAAQSHCQALDAAVQKETVGANDVEVGLLHCEAELALQAEQLRSALAQTRTHTEAVEQAGQSRTARLTAFLQETESEVQRLEAQLTSDLAGLPEALSQLREKADQAAPRLTRSASVLQERLSDLSRGVDQLVRELTEEMVRLEQAARRLQQGARDQRQSLEAQLQACLTSGERLHQEGRAASESLTQRIGSADTDLKSHALHTQEVLKEAGSAARAAVLQAQQELSLQLNRDAQKIRQTVADVQAACQQGAQHAIEQTLGLHLSLRTLCQALEPLVQVEQVVRRTGAA